MLLIPVETVIKPGATVNFDLYVWNDSNKPANVPSLELTSATYLLRDISGARSPKGGGISQTTDHSLPLQVLKPNSVVQKKIAIEIPAQAGDLVEVYVGMASPSNLRSNSVQLFCPNAKGKFE
jgi:hypothetical protein